MRDNVAKQQYPHVVRTAPTAPTELRFHKPKLKRSRWTVLYRMLILAFIAIPTAVILANVALFNGLEKRLKNFIPTLIVQRQDKATEQQVAVTQDLKATTEEAKAVVAELKEHKLRLADNDPLVISERAKNVRLAAEKAATERTLTDQLKKTQQRADELKKRVDKAENKVSTLEDELEVTQQKLALANSEEERQKIINDPAAHLKREDIEVLLLMEKISVQESGGRADALGPWVPLHTMVAKTDKKGKAVKDKDGKTVLVRKIKPGPYNPWIKIGNGKKDKASGQVLEKGVPYDRGYGAYQVMGENVGPWSEEALGVRYTPQLILKKENLADYRKMVSHQIKKLLARYNHNAPDVISVWHSGRPLAKAKKSKDLNMSTVDYTAAVKSADALDPRVWKNARKSEQK